MFAKRFRFATINYKLSKFVYLGLYMISKPAHTLLVRNLAFHTQVFPNLDVYNRKQLDAAGLQNRLHENEEFCFGVVETKSEFWKSFDMKTDSCILSGLAMVHMETGG